MSRGATGAALARAASPSLAAVARALSGLRRARPTGWLATFVVLVLAWQTGLFLALVAGAIALVPYGVVHVAVSAVVAAWLIRRLRRAPADEGTTTALQIVAWSAAAGPFGAFAAAALTLPAEPPAERASREADAESAADDPSRSARVERVHTALLDRRVRLRGAHGIRPLMDVIAEGSRSERLEALRVVYRNYDAQLAAVLRRGLYDPDASVRVLAATVMAKLNGAYGRAIGERQAEVAAEPKLERTWLTLAQARLAYADSGLLEPSRARAQIEIAIGDLLRAIEIEPRGEGSLLLDKAQRLLAAVAR
ncbi:hypothetical protein DFR50_12962 [Roseiarcus fermentans]|uniref:Uncharacterized protein n=1 Tax=Roseiarcus fermentans TaxID=1473586 RepID=A0A366EXK5_9HYPH|nr:hypothetical protein [Roseiarcus fermentans]RBP07132.1 hypothetical protein DFR50_12962 [Roseiarcus fermentans]